MRELQVLLQQDLTRTRILPEQVIRYLADHYNKVAEDDLSTFLREAVYGLEPYEVDLIFSPVFTPGGDDKRPYMHVLGPVVMGADELQGLLAQLLEANLKTVFQFPSGAVVAVPLHPVMIERYLYRLSLDKPLAPGLHEMLQNLPKALQPAKDMLYLLGRDAVWQSSERSQWLCAFIHGWQQLPQQLSSNPASSNPPTDLVNKAVFLTDFLRTYRPVSLANLQLQLQRLIESCQTDSASIDTRQFHDHHLKALYAEAATAHGDAEKERIVLFYNHLMQQAQAVLSDCQAIHPAVV